MKAEDLDKLNAVKAQIKNRDQRNENLKKAQDETQKMYDKSYWHNRKK